VQCNILQLCHEAVMHYWHAASMLIPVGQIITAEQFAQMNLRALQQRDILDPNFSELDPQFNWRNHVQLNMHADLPDAKAITATLDQLGTTTEGQQLIRQASAMQSFRAKSEGAPAVITIKVGKENTFDATTGSLSLSIEQMQAHHFTSTAGLAVPFTLQHVLYHELLHAADGFNHPAHKGLLHDAIERLLTFEGRNATDGFEQFLFRQTQQNTLYFEEAALQETNRFMGKYFCEAPRRDIQSQPAPDGMTTSAAPAHYELGALQPGICPNLIIPRNQTAAR